MNEINVLSAPAGYLLDDMYGSEFYWSYKIMESLGRHNVNFIALCKKNNIAELPTNIRAYKIGKTEDYYTYRDKLNFVLEYYLAARKLLKKNEIDILHHILPFGYKQTFNLIPLLKSTRKKPFIIGPVQVPHTINYGDEEKIFNRTFDDSLHENLAKYNDLLETILKVRSPVLYKLFKSTLRNADILIAINSHSKRLYSQFVPDEKIRVIPPGVDINRFYFSENNHYKHEILTVGYLVKRKGIDYLVNAMPDIIKFIPNAQLRIIGDGPEKPNLQRLCKKLCVERNVIFQGLVQNSDISKFYRDSSIFCLPSHSETFGNVFLEAMSCGRPVITTPTIGAMEIIEDGKTGILVPPRESKKLANNIIDLLKDGDTMKKMGLLGRKVVEDKYDWNIISKKYFEVYRHCVDSS